MFRERMKEIGPRIKKVSDELTAELERSPSISEIANRLEVSRRSVRSNGNGTKL